MELASSFLCKLYWDADMHTVRCPPGFLQMLRNMPCSTVHAFLASSLEMSAVGGGKGSGHLEKKLQDMAAKGLLPTSVAGMTGMLELARVH